VRDGKHLFTYLKVKISKMDQNDLKKRVFGNDMNDLKYFEIEWKSYYFNNFLNIKIIKKTLIFK
jgi:hypothetical protein